MAFIWTMFVVGSFGFYTIILLELCLLLTFYHVVECEDKPMTSSSTLVMILLSLLLIWFGDFNVYIWMWENKLLTGLALTCYIMVGVIVSLLMYAFRLRNLRQRMPDLKKRYTEYISGVHDYDRHRNTYLDFTSWVSRFENESTARMLKLETMRNWIIYWITYYPIGLTYKLIINGFRGIGAYLYDNFFIGLYQFFYSKIAVDITSIDETASIQINKAIEESDNSNEKL